MICSVTEALAASAFFFSSRWNTLLVSQYLLNCNAKYLVILNFIVLSLERKKESCGGLFHPQVCKFKFFPAVRIEQKSSSITCFICSRQNCILQAKNLYIPNCTLVVLHLLKEHNHVDAAVKQYCLQSCNLYYILLLKTKHICQVI